MDFFLKLVDIEFPFKFLENVSMENILHEGVRHLEAISIATAEMAEKSFIDGPLFTAIVGALVAALAAYIVSHLHWSYTRRRENICAAAMAMTETINRLEAAAVGYWLLDYTQRNNDIYAQEIEIKSLLRAQIGHFKQLSCLVSKKNILTGNIEKKAKDKLSAIRKKIEEDFDLISGDGFESSQRVKNPVLAGKISQVCAVLKLELSSITFEI